MPRRTPVVGLVLAALLLAGCADRQAVRQDRDEPAYAAAWRDGPPRPKASDTGDRLLNGFGWVAIGALVAGAVVAGAVASSVG